jgi:cytochrome d ubiquinol oxidase subunit II
VIDTVFSLSSILTPFALGSLVGGIATGRVPVGNAAGGRFSGWFNSTSILVGVLAVATSGYLAAVYLAADAARRNERELERAFRVRALGAGVVAGALALAGILVVRSDARSLYDALVSGRALPAVIVSTLAGVATLALVYRRRFEAARYSAAVAVAAVVAGWALAQWPTILPGRSTGSRSARHARRRRRGRARRRRNRLPVARPVVLAHARRGIRRRPATLSAPRAGRLPKARPALLVRTAVACLIVGFGLLTVADAGWAHAVGVAALFAFMVAGLPGARPRRGSVSSPQPRWRRARADVIETSGTSHAYSLGFSLVRQHTSTARSASCPQRDSNPRYGLERAATWAASRWGPGGRRIAARRARWAGPP